MTGWQPIETAPRADATKRRKVPGPTILLWDGKQIWMAADCIVNRDTRIRSWYTMIGDEAASHGDYGPSPVCENPTHWMPLPEPPTT